MQSKHLVSLLIVVLVIGGGSFYGGITYAKSKPTSRTGARMPGTSNGGVQGFRAGPNGGGFSAGEVISKDATSLTLKLTDGGSKIIFYSTSTNVGKMASGTIDEISAGTQVTVNGTANTDGSVAASMIQIRPAGQNRPDSVR